MKFSYVFCFSLTLLCCTKYEEFDKNDIALDEMDVHVSDKVYEKALTRALNVLTTLECENNSREVITSRTVRSCDKIVSLGSGYRSKSNETNYYLFNFKDDSGFALVSGDERDSIMVYLAAEKGNLDVKHLTDDSSISFLMDMINQYQMKFFESDPHKVLYRGAPEDDYTFTTNSISVYNVRPVLTTNWGQGYPYNAYVGGQKNMGCGPIALAQIMAFYKAPAKAKVAGQDYTYDWNSIANFTYSSIIDQSQINKVSKFIYSVGTACGINYNGNDVGVNINNVRNALVGTFGYKSKSVVDYSNSDVVNSLFAKRLVYMRGDNNNGPGHAWVVDGCSEIKTEYRAYDSNGKLVENTVLNDYVYDTYHKYLHLNIGWDGYTNGNYNYYYEYNSSIDYRVWIYSDVFTFAGNSFNKNLRIICNIYY